MVFIHICIVQQCTERIICHSQVGFIPSAQGWLNIQKSINLIQHINSLKKGNYTMMSVGAEKAFDHIEHSLVIKTLSKLGVEENFLNLKNNIYKNLQQTSNLQVRDLMLSP